MHRLLSTLVVTAGLAVAGPALADRSDAVPSDVPAPIENAIADPARGDAAADDERRKPSPAQEPPAGAASSGTPPATDALARAAPETPSRPRRAAGPEALANQAPMAVGNVIGNDFVDPMRRRDRESPTGAL